MKRGFCLKSLIIWLLFLMSSIFLPGQLLNKADLIWEYNYQVGSIARFSFGNFLQCGDRGKNYVIVKLPLFIRINPCKKKQK